MSISACEKILFFLDKTKLLGYVIFNRGVLMKISKDEIIKTALYMFLDKGYTQVTIQDICDQLGITKPTFYNYIHAKEELILGLYDATITSLVNNTYQLVDVDTHYEQLLVIFSHLIKETRKYGYDLFSQMFIANLKENHHSFDMRDNLTALMTLIIKKAQDKKEILNTSPPDVLYTALAHAYTGYEALWCINKGESDFERHFFESLNAIVMVSDELKDKYQQYL